jgi:hypothetical protein
VLDWRLRAPLRPFLESKQHGSHERVDATDDRHASIASQRLVRPVRLAGWWLEAVGYEIKI